jgi:hypothetical protein
MARAADTVFYWEPKASAAYMTGAVKFDSGLPNVKVTAYGAMVGANLGWRNDYVHLILAADYTEALFTGSTTTTTSVGGKSISTTSSNNGTGGILDFGAGFGWEWNIPMMTTLYIKGGTGVASSGTIASGSIFGGGLELAYFFSEKAKLNIGTNVFSQSQGGGSLQITEIYVGVSFPMAINYPDSWWRK